MTTAFKKKATQIEKQPKSLPQSRFRLFLFSSIEGPKTVWLLYDL